MHPFVIMHAKMDCEEKLWKIDRLHFNSIIIYCDVSLSVIMNNVRIY